jgi:hypothetical protein
MAINPVTGEDIPAPAPQPDQQPDPFDPLAAAEYWRKKNEESTFDSRAPTSGPPCLLRRRPCSAAAIPIC